MSLSRSFHMALSPRLLLVPLLATAAACSEQQMAATLPFNEMPGQALTWNKDVLPIVRQHCQGCHTPDGIAPFSMMSFGDAAEHADMMVEKVQNHQMPPWMPKQGCGEFQDERRLSDDEIATFVQWAADGAIEGAAGTEAPGKDATAQHLASVDATLMPDTIYTPMGDPEDVAHLDDYHCFILDPKLDEDRFLVGFEVEPGVTREVHHVLLYPAAAADALAQDAKTPEPGWTCFGGSGTGDQNILGGWVPGMPPNHFPATTGIRMKKGDLIVMQVHYNLLNGPPLPDRTTVKLDYAEGPVEHEAQFFPAPNLDFVIPAHAKDFTSTASIKVPIDLKVWGMIPHMHTLGKEISVKTDDECYIDIPSWDFHWQQTYFFKNPNGIPIKAGTKATLSCTWNNPRDTEVRWGESTSDEMCLAFMYITY